MSTLTAGPDLLTPADLARRWGVAVGTLANLRSAGRGPGFVKVLSRVRYPLDLVRQYEAANTQRGEQ